MTASNTQVSQTKMRLTSGELNKGFIQGDLNDARKLGQNS